MSGEGNFKVNYAGLGDASASIRSGGQDIRSSLDNLDGRLKPLQQEWEGETQQAYIQAQKKWNEGMAEMQLVLDAVGRAVDEASQTFQGADKAGSGLF